MENLTLLTELELYDNQITTIENLDTLVNLELVEMLFKTLSTYDLSSIMCIYDWICVSEC